MSRVTTMPFQKQKRFRILIIGAIWLCGMGVGTVPLVGADEVQFKHRSEVGVSWIAFEATPEVLGTGNHPNVGWDFFDGKKKQFWVGTGWKTNQADHRNQWGIWDANGKQHSFRHSVKKNRTDRIVVRIDFGKLKLGDEEIHVWVNPSEDAEPHTRNADAHIERISLTGFDSAKSFTGAGSKYQLASPSLAANYSDVLKSRTMVVEATDLSDVKMPKSSKSTANTEIEQLFLSRIKPLFAQKCGACHGETAREFKGEFDMRSRASMIKGGESGEPGIDLKKPEQSPLLLAVMWKDGLEMPPKENDRLSKEQIALVRQWIEAGAPWPARTSVAGNDPEWAKPDATGGVRVRTSGGQSDDWTNRRYRPEDLWAYQPLQKVKVPWDALNKNEPQHPVEAFLRRKLNTLEKTPGIQPAPKADRHTLLRRATYGLTGLPPTQQEIEAFVSKSSRDDFEELIDRLLKSPHYGERMAQHWLDVVRYADSNGFSRDEFRKEAHRYRTYVVRSFNEDKPYDLFVREQIAGDMMKTGGQDAASFLWMGPWEHTAMSVAAVTRQLWLDDVTNSVGVTFLGHQLRCAKCHDHKFDPVPTRDYYRFQAVFGSTKHNVKAGDFKLQPQKPQAIAILQGGALESPTTRVEPGALSLLASTVGFSFDAGQHQNPRQALAEWIGNERNPLTARVIVNRVWQMHFGRGIVATPNDFGKMGADPTHPELLDWLAGWFIENDWSLKKLHQLIMTTATYQRASFHPQMDRLQTLDPGNEKLAWFPSRRMSAEELRDSLLAISGELNRKIGGPSVYPEINWEVAFQARLAMGKLVPPYQPDPAKSARNRRSLYAVRIRNLGHPMMEVFNRPGSELSCERRDETTVTPQVFTLLHGEFVHERSLALANSIAGQETEMEKQVEAVFRAIYGRVASPSQFTAGVAHVNKQVVLHERLHLVPKPLPTEISLEDIVERTGESRMVKFKLKKLVNYEEDLKPWDVPASTRALADLCLVLFNSSEFLYIY